MRSSVLGFLGACAAAIAMAGCGSGQTASAPPSSARGSAPAQRPAEVARISPETAPIAPRQSDDLPRVVALGDSLTAGLGLSPDQAYPFLLQQRIDDKGWKLRVINAGVSGDTSAGALRRLDQALDGDVRVLIVALGGNDGLRGLPPDALRRNLADIIMRGQGGGASIVLAGMEAPPNFGHVYTEAFHRVYPDLAAMYKVPLVPFLLEGVAGIDALNQRDGLHPNVEGTRIVAENIWRVLEPVLRSEARRRPVANEASPSSVSQ